MTHWKRVMFVAWLIGVVLLAGTWLGSRLMVLEGQATLGSTELRFTIRQQSSLVIPASSTTSLFPARCSFPMLVP